MCDHATNPYMIAKTNRTRDNRRGADSQPHGDTLESIDHRESKADRRQFVCPDPTNVEGLDQTRDHERHHAKHHETRQSGQMSGHITLRQISR